MRQAIEEFRELIQTTEDWEELNSGMRDVLIFLEIKSVMQFALRYVETYMERSKYQEILHPDIAEKFEGIKSAILLYPDKSVSLDEYELGYSSDDVIARTIVNRTLFSLHKMYTNRNQKDLFISYAQETVSSILIILRQQYSDDLSVELTVFGVGSDYTQYKKAIWLNLVDRLEELIR